MMMGRWAVAWDGTAKRNPTTRNKPFNRLIGAFPKLASLVARRSIVSYNFYWSICTPSERSLMSSVLVIGTVALDNIITPTGEASNVLGGSATYFAWAASYFTNVHL